FSTALILSVAVGASQAGRTTTIERDYVIIGGGSSGVYSAIYLKDKGKSVAVVEAKDILGGHTETYVDPVTSSPINLAVIYFQTNQVAKDYFARLNISTITHVPGSSQNPTQYYNYATGEKVSYSPSPDTGSALQAYAAQLVKYPYLETGFNLPSPVPEDLLLKFGDFVDKYQLGPAVRTIWNVAQGFGNLLEQPTVYVLKIFGLGVLQSFTAGFTVVASGDNHEIYDKAATILGSDAFLSSKIASVTRSNKGVEVKFSGPNGETKIKASKLILTIPPKLENLRAFDLSNTERQLFGKFSNSVYYAGTVRHNGSLSFPIENYDPAAQFGIPDGPGIYSLSPTGVPNLTNVKYGLPSFVPPEEVGADIIQSIEGLSLNPGEVSLAVLKTHYPFELTVKPDDIANGFYTQLYNLQGTANTYYTGAAFHTHDSAQLWQFTKTLLDGVVV
ncbi:FAD/NAD(P)-binding domain-containing protein, partial [Atractiella rhizophila]